MDSELFEFANEPGMTQRETKEEWKILSVEDDPIFQSTICHILKNNCFLGRPLRLLTAPSAQKATEILSLERDIAIIIVDVVMETDDSGLRLVQSVRDVVGDHCMRVILLTGEPGMAPQGEVMAHYDIDEYWNKSDVTQEKLISVVNSNLRTWHSMNELRKAKTGLQLLLDASRNLYDKHSLGDFSRGVLLSISNLIGLSAGGVICGMLKDGQDARATVIVSSGSYSDIGDELIEERMLPKFHTSIMQAIESGDHVFTDDYSLLYFPTTEIDGAAYYVIVDSPTPVNDFYINVLRVFSENVRSGFSEIALMNKVSRLACLDERLGTTNRIGMLRELAALTLRERSETYLISVFVEDYQKMMVALGNEYCEGLLSAFLVELKHKLPPSAVLAATGLGSFSILISSKHKPIIDDLLLTRVYPVEIAGIFHHLPVVFGVLAIRKVMGASAQEQLYLSELVNIEAQRRGLTHFYYDETYRENITSSYLLLQDLQAALTADRFCLHLQPKVHLRTGQVVGFEALVRWEKEEGHYIPPDVFIPLAEASGLITVLDKQVLNKTLAVITMLKDEGYHLPVSFNASVADLENPLYVNRLFEIVDKKLVDVSMLEIEITESAAMKDYETHELLLRHLLRSGVGVSIDDFGTGYSSLAHIARLAATTLKIDRSFVQGLGTSDNDRHVVEMVIRLGQRFGYSVIAEGVETEAQRQVLMEMGCETGQGYLYARPMPVTEAIAWLKQNPVESL